MDLEAFIEQSNDIEGEPTYIKKELPIYKWWLSIECNEENLKKLHYELCTKRKQLEPSDRGVYRKIPVYLGVQEMTNPGKIRSLMIQFFGDLNTRTPFESHIIFEKIHPFLDLNGRTGRAIWLHSNRNTRLSFLHLWYYQSINFYGQRKSTTM